MSYCRNRSVEEANHGRELSLSSGDCGQVEAFSVEAAQVVSVDIRAQQKMCGASFCLLFVPAKARNGERGLRSIFQ
jgi:hypothetical protein